MKFYFLVDCIVEFHNSASFNFFFNKVKIIKGMTAVIKKKCMNDLCKVPVPVALQVIFKTKYLTALPTFACNSGDVYSGVLHTTRRDMSNYMYIHHHQGFLRYGGRDTRTSHAACHAHHVCGN